MFVCQGCGVGQGCSSMVEHVALHGERPGSVSIDRTGYVPCLKPQRYRQLWAKRTWMDQWLTQYTSSSYVPSPSLWCSYNLRHHYHFHWMLISFATLVLISPPFPLRVLSKGWKPRPVFLSLELQVFMPWGVIPAQPQPLAKVIIDRCRKTMGCIGGVCNLQTGQWGEKIHLGSGLPNFSAAVGLRCWCVEPNRLESCTLCSLGQLMVLIRAPQKLCIAFQQNIHSKQ